jgi:hypothetical protein
VSNKPNFKVGDIVQFKDAALVGEMDWTKFNGFLAEVVSKDIDDDRLIRIHVLVGRSPHPMSMSTFGVRVEHFTFVCRVEDFDNGGGT